MPPVVNKVSQWIINSTWFNKNCAIVGATAAAIKIFDYVKEVLG